MYWPVLESAGGEVVSGETGSESLWAVSESEFSRLLPRPSAGFVRVEGAFGEKSAPSEVTNSCEVSISGVRPHPRAKLESEWK